jgi:hypothetical protein
MGRAAQRGRARPARRAKTAEPGGAALDRGFWEKLQFKTQLADGFRFADVVETKSGVITVTPSGEVYGGGAYDGIFDAGFRYDRNGIFRTYSLGAVRADYD